MTKRAGATPYESEAAMCAQFCDWVRLKGWTPYAETAGWDVLCVAPDGFQIGVQAKLLLNPAVVCQAIEENGWFGTNPVGPDCRAVLVPAAKAQNGLSRICAALGVTVIKAAGPGEITKRGMIALESSSWGGRIHRSAFDPDLPSARDPWKMREWYDLCTGQRHDLPDYVPDVVAGASGPVQLTDWKVRAIKISILAQRQGYVTRQDFADLKISIHRWLTLSWLTYHPTDRGRLVPCRMPDFKAQHPRNYAEIEADFEKWKPKPSGLLASVENAPPPDRAGKVTAE
jgi:hypothetical protein